jgi:hypothetical protein
MPVEQSRDPKQFADFELAGWESNIAGYNAAFGAVARQTVEAMLDAARVTNGRRVLDVCCGPGMLAGGASKRGATSFRHRSSAGRYLPSNPVLLRPTCAPTSQTTWCASGRRPAN